MRTKNCDISHFVSFSLAHLVTLQYKYVPIYVELVIRLVISEPAWMFAFDPIRGKVQRCRFGGHNH